MASQLAVKTNEYNILIQIHSKYLGMSCSGETVEVNELIQIRPKIIQQLKKAKYGVADHSTVELCHWTKKSFKNEGDCYKHKFYGISTHRCMEFSPAGMFCENRCVYCWRPMEFYDSLKMEPDKVAEPREIVTKLMEERKKLIVGHYGDPRQDRQKLDESLLPSHYAISLSGEEFLRRSGRHPGVARRQVGDSRCFELHGRAAPCLSVRSRPPQHKGRISIRHR